ncbi:Uncharacterised protein [Mycobacteroides abscessus subsp. abscessus]|nr:Uncharacterised protein [Mycobacteroides abscessus subsp. abscessus]
MSTGAGAGGASASARNGRATTVPQPRTRRTIAVGVTMLRSVADMVVIQFCEVVLITAVSDRVVPLATAHPL